MNHVARQTHAAPSPEWIADNTRKAYSRALSQFSAWLSENCRDLTDGALADYLTEMFDAGLAPASGSQVVSAVRFRALLQGADPEIGPKTHLAMSRFSRLGSGRGRGQAAGLQWEAADRIAASSAKGSLAGMRDAAIITVMSDALLRVSEAADIQVDHIQPSPNGATLLVPRSKTDQEGEGRTLFIGRQTMSYIQKWRLAAGVHDGYLFRAVYGDKVKDGGLTTKTLTRIVQRRAKECGYGDVSGHSLRVGAAQSLASEGASLVEMQMAGRWKDPRMPERYAQAQMAERGAVAKLRYGV